MNAKDAMSDQKDLLLIETMVKLAAITNILVKKAILTEKELQEEMTAISKQLVEQMKVISPSIIDN